jgi:2-[(L-alanin-3-ylcarbamoyl)methyl]-2-hydroxybutanedioate decarboxylase
MTNSRATNPLPPHIEAAIRAAKPPRCVYAYDTATLRAAADKLALTLPSGAELLYAMKANSHPAVVAAMADRCDGIEVASGGELAIARAAGARRIAFAGPAKTDDELAAAIDAHRAGLRVTLNVESVLELRRIGALTAGSRGGPPLPIALRVNRSGTNLSGTHRMTGIPTPFGFDEADLPSAIALANATPGVDVIGFHLHAVSNNLDAAAHAAFIRDAACWAATQPIALRELNVGGGLGVDYTGSATFDLAGFRTGLAPVADLLPAGAHLVLEPGRWLAASAGWYGAEVVDLKRTHGTWFAVLRGGTHHFRLPAAWGYSHRFVVVPIDEWPYAFGRPTVTADRVHAVGELCTPRDVLTRGQPVRELRAGDLLVFPNAGAYGWDISHHDFLRHGYPEMVVI